MRARPKAGGKVYYYLDTGGKPRKEIPLGSDYPEAVRKWAELTASSRAPAITFKEVADRYQREALPLKAPRTQKDNLAELAKLMEFFNNPPVDLEAIEPVHVRQYLDWRAAKVRANREKALLSHIWNFARQKGITAMPNPCRGVKGFTETGRKDVYITDAVYQAVYQSAGQPLKDALDLAYITGQRPADVLKMDVSHVRGGALHVKQNKTGAELRIAIKDDWGVPNGLGVLLDRIAQGKRDKKITSMALVCSVNGLRMTTSALDNAFDRARARAMVQHRANPDMVAAIKQFQFRDIRAKAGTDKADATDMHEAQRQLGHTSITMTEHYVRQGKLVTPTK
jgi:integrase